MRRFSRDQPAELFPDTAPILPKRVLIALSPLVEAAGGKVARVLCLVDRGEGAIERFAERGITLEPVYTRADLTI